MSSHTPSTKLSQIMSNKALTLPSTKPSGSLRAAPEPHNTASLPAYFATYMQLASSKANSNQVYQVSQSASTRTLPSHKKKPAQGQDNSEELSNLQQILTPTAITKKRYSAWERWDRWVKITMEFFPYSSIRMRVRQAMKEGKIFSVTWGPWYTIRRGLNKRGWVEKPRLNLEDFGFELSPNGELRGMADPFLGGRERDVAWVVGALQNYRPNLVWNMGFFNPKSFRYGQLLNRQPKPPTSFHTKVGMVLISQSLHWYQEERVAVTRIPRCYRLFIPEELSSFVGDFFLTACTGLLEWIVGAIDRVGAASVICPGGTVSADSVLFAVRQIEHYVNVRASIDLDTSHSVPTDYTDYNFERLLDAHHRVLYMRSKLFLGHAFTDSQSLYEAAKRALKVIAPYWPQLNIDGTHNLWICKPGYQMRGDGVSVRNNLHKILGLLDLKTFKGSDSDWVVQKYIERPLLIFNTKFDIRQWFLVTSFSPLTVWFYKESYLRFCSKPFATEDFDERIHLCNSAVQSKYSYSTGETNLPKDKIWDNYTFQAYLRSSGVPDVWDRVILPGMKRALTGVLLASQDSLYDCPNTCFQLYGADFMLSEDFQPWLIEINNLPLLSSSCHVLARMSKAVLEDTLKVALDYRRSPHADTGLFELIYQQQTLEPRCNYSYEVVIQGQRIQANAETPKRNVPRPVSAITLGEIGGSESEGDERPASLASGVLKLSTRFRLQDPPKVNFFAKTPMPNQGSRIRPHSAMDISFISRG